MKEIDWEGLERLYGWSREEAEQKMRQAWAFWLEQTKRQLQDVKQNLARYVELLGKSVLTVEEYLALGGKAEYSQRPTKYCIGLWSCGGNVECPVTTVEVVIKYHFTAPPDAPPPMKCPQCGQKMEFHHYRA